MNEQITSAKEFVARNQIKIFIASLAVLTAYAAMLTAKKREIDEFLEKHNLLDEYYNPER